MIAAPSQFKLKHHFRYPEDNEVEFERWFYENWTEEDRREREYLPIFWTSYFCKHRYGRDQRANRQLQNYITSKLDKRKQYYSIVQFDLGPVVKLPTNVKIFAMSGPVVHYPIPLICQPHAYEFDSERDIFANFIGAMTHPVRKKMVEVVRNKPGFLITSQRHSLPEFCNILSRSVFTLCPRGFGVSSFRIQEALQYGSIPVYISDTFIFPGNVDFNEYGVVIHYNQLSEIPTILSSLSSEEIERKQEKGRIVYNDMFTYKGCKQLILNNL